MGFYGGIGRGREGGEGGEGGGGDQQQRSVGTCLELLFIIKDFFLELF